MTKKENYYSMKRSINSINEQPKFVSKFYFAEGMFETINKYQKDEKLYTAQDVLDLLLVLESEVK